MDIAPAYSFLLGRPWIHSAGAVPSSLHQKVKFIIDKNLISISGEEDLLVTKPPSMPYVEAAEEALESAFQSFEVVNVTYIGEGSPIPKPRPSGASMMMAKVMLENSHHPGKGLGRYCQGTEKPIHLPRNDERLGLGYEPTRTGRRRIQAEKREREDIPSQ